MGGEFGLVVDRGQGVDADERMERGQGERHVAHVGRARGALGVRTGRREGAPEFGGVALVERGHVRVGAVLGVRLVAAGDGQRGAGRQRAGLEAAVDFGLDGVQLAQSLGAHDVAGFGVGRNDVGRAAAVGDDAVDAVGRMDVLA